MIADRIELSEEQYTELQQAVIEIEHLLPDDVFEIGEIVLHIFHGPIPFPSSHG